MSKFDKYLQLLETQEYKYRIMYNYDGEDDNGELKGGLTLKDALKEYNRHYPKHGLKTHDDIINMNTDRHYYIEVDK